MIRHMGVSYPPRLSTILTIRSPVIQICGRAMADNDSDSDKLNAEEGQT